jgi:hypothetical protein
MRTSITASTAAKALVDKEERKRGFADYREICGGHRPPLQAVLELFSWDSPSSILGARNWLTYFNTGFHWGLVM